MKKILITQLLSVVVFSSFAQNPFKEIGKEVEVLTLSNGKYPEHFSNDTLRRVGSVMFNTVTNKIEYFISEEQLISEATAKPYIVSRWLSRDPYAFEFPFESPYTFVSNSPLMFADHEGNFKIVVTTEAKEAKGSAIEIARFTEIVNNLEAYLNENPQVVAKIAEQTGFSNTRILNDAKAGVGPTIRITDNHKGASAPIGGTIDFDYTLVEFFENHQGDELTEGAVNLIAGAIVLHEYTHYGDRKTNNGKITSDPTGDDPGPGNQNSTSRYKHRGLDTEVKVLGTTISVEGDAKYDDDGYRIGGEIKIPDEDINKIKRRVTLEPKATKPKDKKSVLPKDQKK